MEKCVNMIKTTINFEKKGFIIKNNKLNFEILKAFLKINVIKFIKKEGRMLIVYINYINNKPVFTNIINVFRSSNKKFISLNQLKFLNSKNKYIMIISTSKGILNSYEAINSNTGGLIIAEIWN